MRYKGAYDIYETQDENEARLMSQMIAEHRQEVILEEIREPRIFRINVKHLAGGSKDL